MFLRLAVLTVLSAAFVAAPQQPSRPTFRTEANYVRVDVFPTKDGAPVTDLTKDDFEIIEDRAPQRIEQFERVVIRPAASQETRVEPNTVGEMRSMLESSRARVFVIFLDVYHVEVAGSHDIRKPLIAALDRMIGPDDLVGVMTPEMSATDIAFARKTTTIAGMLTRHWAWGERERLNSVDPVEDQYRACYPGAPPPPGCLSDAGIATAMIDRRREKRTLDALQDLVRYLRGVREERKAILAVSDGWLLFRPDGSLMRRICDAPGGPDVQIDPRTGKLTNRTPSVMGNSDSAACERDRMNLAQVQDDREFQDVLDESNRANASFYPIDPRGLAVFDTPIVPVNGPSLYAPAPTASLGADRAMLQSRLTSLRTLADATDGLAIVDSNDLAGGLQRVAADLSSYYLLGYYSSGKLDGKFHSITVRVKRPGVHVRARRGYLAATPSAAAASAATAAAAAMPARAEAEAEAEAGAIAAVVAPLAALARELPLRVQAAAGWSPTDPPSASVWVEGELSAAREFDELWRSGATATIELAPADGASIASAHATVAPGARTFQVALAPASPLAAGEYIVRVAARGADTALPTRETLHLTVPAPPRATGMLWSRRGPSTANRETPTADARFRRGDQAIVSIPAVAADAATARLLDRNGKALAIPVAAALRTDADGARWLTARLAVAPLAPGDYIIELSEGNDRTLAAFRVVP